MDNTTDIDSSNGSSNGSSCETNEATSNPMTGIVLVLLACICYASGNCLQRYSLLRRKDEKVFYVLNRHMGWLLGACVYFSANGIYAVALSFAPVSVLAAVFSLTIVANATCAYFVLGDKVPRLALPGYAAVLAGSIVFSVTIQAEVCHFEGDELKEVMSSPAAIIYWCIMGSIILGGILFAYPFEKKYPVLTDDVENDEGAVEEEGDGEMVKPTTDNPHEPPRKQQTQLTDQSEGLEEAVVQPMNGEHTEYIDVTEHESKANQPSSLALLLAGFIYPSSLGATEAVGALILKGVNSLLTTLATDEETEDEETNSYLDLWIGFMGVGVFIFAGIVVWLRLTYARFEITAAFPVEFGVLTFASVVGGFAVFEDHQYVTSHEHWAGVIFASLLIVGGIATVGWASWKEKKDSGEDEGVVLGK